MHTQAQFTLKGLWLPAGHSRFAARQPARQPSPTRKQSSTAPYLKTLRSHRHLGKATPSGLTLRHPAGVVVCRRCSTAPLLSDSEPPVLPSQTSITSSGLGVPCTAMRIPRHSGGPAQHRPASVSTLRVLVPINRPIIPRVSMFLLYNTYVPQLATKILSFPMRQISAASRTTVLAHVRLSARAVLTAFDPVRSWERHVLCFVPFTPPFPSSSSGPLTASV